MEETQSSENFQDEDEYEVMKVRQIIINDISKYLQLCKGEGTESITNSFKKTAKYLNGGRYIKGVV